MACYLIRTISVLLTEAKQNLDGATVFGYNIEKPQHYGVTVIHYCFEQRPIPVYNNGSNIRDWLSVENHCVDVNNIK